MTCATCRYFKPDVNPNLRGECRRSPPALVYLKYPTYSRSEWPTTFRDDWCGEYLPVSENVSTLPFVPRRSEA